MQSIHAKLRGAKVSHYREDGIAAPRPLAGGASAGSEPHSSSSDISDRGASVAGQPYRHNNQNHLEDKSQEDIRYNAPEPVGFHMYPMEVDVGKSSDAQLQERLDMLTNLIEERQADKQPTHALYGLRSEVRAENIIKTQGLY